MLQRSWNGGRTEGVASLWTGLGPNMARNALINAVELASYDQIKQSLLGTGCFKDNVVTHLAAGLTSVTSMLESDDLVGARVGAGFLAVCIGSPADVVKSRNMHGPSTHPSSFMHATVWVA